MVGTEFNLSQDLLHEIFKYRDGKLFWKKTPIRSDVIGKETSCISQTGYKTVKIGKKQYLVHRLIYLMFYGNLPKTIDHIDNDRLNNKIENLRSAIGSENSYNQKKRINNTTGIKGVGFNPKCNKFFARCQVNKKQNWLGFFPNLQLAENAVKAFRAQHHGEFANHG